MGKFKIKKPQDLSLKSIFSRDTMQSFSNKVTAMFGMDRRSIAAFRVVMALCVIGDVIERSTDLRVMYTEEGVMPRSLIVSKYSSNFFMPVHLINTSFGFQAFLFAMHIVFAFCMLIGYRTKTFSFLTWFMTISLQAYNGIVGHGGDVFFRMMLFINMFLPTTEFFNIDNASFYDANYIKSKNDYRRINGSGAVGNDESQQQILVDQNQQQQSNNNIVDVSSDPMDKKDILVGDTNIEMGENNSSVSLSSSSSSSAKSHPNQYRYLSFATFCVLLQMGLMYSTSYFHKSGEEWKNGEATFYALTLDYFATDFAKFIINFRTPLRLLTIAVAKWELAGIFFMFSPIFTDHCRLFGAIGFAFMHLGFVLCLRLGLFFWVTAGAQIINVPPFLWEMIYGYCEKKILKGQRPVRIFYNTTSPMSQKIALAYKTFFMLSSTASFAPINHLKDEITISTMSPTSATPFESESDGEYDDADEVQRSVHKRHAAGISSNNNYTLSGGSSSMFGKKDILGDDWLVVIDSNGIRKRNVTALNYITSKSPLLFPFAMAFANVPQKVVDYFAKLMDSLHSRSQQNQILTGKRSPYQKKKIPRQYSVYYSIVNNIWMAFICWFLLAYNLNVFHINVGYKHSYHQLAYLLRLDQGWNMFSPQPPKSHWWHVIHGQLDDGTQVELFKNEGLFNFEINTEVNFEKPDPFYPSYGNHRWFKYWENGFNSNNADALRLELGRYICREFNSRHYGPEMLYKFSVYFVHEYQNLDGTVSASSHQSLWNHICYEKK
ncbi:hypothetical protein CYY_001352 [Polysphondylium violaceum]|uniref:HTTM-like domain-containing protein n=1 Tax=Polysphondylium violaceum TaxID=133409 RepID=A0A8J4Q3F0_9MYCE|nr:hypothetical protein CYY_001352 [Polysphondylium violaceum]